MGKKCFSILRILISCVVLFLIACHGGGGSNGGGSGSAQDSGVGSDSVTVTHLAGSLGGVGSADGTGTSARFYNPSGITSDGTNLYVADGGNNTIRKIVIATGEVTTLAGTAGSTGSTDGTGAAARFWGSTGITSDGTSLYVADTYNNTIRKIVIATGEVTTFAGMAGNCGSIDGTGAAARFCTPSGITSDGTNLYVSDSDTIRKIVIATGEVTTLAGTTAGSCDSIDGTGAAAHFCNPHGITNDGTNLYVADSLNRTIRKIVIATGEVTTLAGLAGTVCGSMDGTGAGARFCYPAGITNHGTNLYVSDSGNNTIRKIVIATGAVTTLAGTTACIAGSTDGTGAAACFNDPSGITIDGANLYVADSSNNTIRKIVIATEEVTTFAGMASTGSTDGTGAATRFYGPTGITSDGTNLYVADTHNNTIRKIVIATGEVTTLAGTAGISGSADGTGAAARFFFSDPISGPTGITNDGTCLYVADSGNNTIRKIVIATGVVTTLAGTAGSTDSTDGTGAAAHFYNPSGITSDGTNLYVADSFNNTIRKIVIATGEVTTFAGTAYFNFWRHCAYADGTGAAAGFCTPSGITNDGTNLYVSDSYNNTIRKIVIATGEVTTFAGTAGSMGFTDSTGAAARFSRPTGITNDGTNLYVSDSYNNTIRKIMISTGEVTTLAGTAGSVGSTDGTGATALFNYPSGITRDGTNLYVADRYNNVIRKISM